jgi:hypothetical protein
VHKPKNRITDRCRENTFLLGEFLDSGEKATPLPKPPKGVLHKNQGHRLMVNADH